MLVKVPHLLVNSARELRTSAEAVTAPTKMITTARTKSATRSVIFLAMRNALENPLWRLSFAKIRLTGAALRLGSVSEASSSDITFLLSFSQ